VDYPPLLPAGLHPKTLGELEQLCVTDFPLSRSRAPIFVGFRRLVEHLSTLAIQGDLWVDGSFVTRKIEPGDIDVALSLTTTFWASAVPAQRTLLSWFGSTDGATRANIKRDYSCDSYVFVDIPAGQPGYPGRDMRQYWLDQFGSDRSGNVKGIAVLSIPVVLP